MAFPGQFSYFEVLREERNDYHTAADNQAVPEKTIIFIFKKENDVVKSGQELLGLVT